MISMEQMLIRFVVALAVGALMGWERESIGKEAGIRTSMLVAAGSALFTMASFLVPHLIGIPADQPPVDSSRVMAGIVTGIGFLGAGIILKTGGHVRGLTTAALIWTVASVGMLVGLGLLQFAILVAVVISGLLYITRKLEISERVRPRTTMPEEWSDE